MTSQDRSRELRWGSTRGQRVESSRPGLPRRFLTWLAPIIAIGGAVVLALVVIVNTLS